MEQLFTAPSGNVARIEAAVVGDAHTSLAVNWQEYPTQADMDAFHDWFAALHPELRQRVARDMSGKPHAEIAARMMQFAATGKTSLPEEN